MALTKLAFYGNESEMAATAFRYPVIPVDLRVNPQFAKYLDDYNIEESMQLLLEETKRSLRYSGENMVPVEVKESSCPIIYRIALDALDSRKLMLRATAKVAEFIGKAVGAGVGALIKCIFGRSFERNLLTNPPQHVVTHSPALMKLSPSKNLGVPSSQDGIAFLMKAPTALPIEDVETDDEDRRWYSVNEFYDEPDSDDFTSILADDDQNMEMSKKEEASLRWDRWMKDRKRRRGIEMVSPRELTRVPVRDISTTTILSKLSYESVVEMGYHTDPEIRDLLKDQIPGFPIFIDGGAKFDTQVYVFLSQSSRTLYVAFRGTQTWKDVVHDLDCKIVPWCKERPQVLVHSGFRKKLRSVEDELLMVTKEHSDLFDKIVLTGHSLGGALATMASPIVGEAHPKKTVECMTFGAPRVGNEIFVQWFHSNVDVVLRIVNDFDPIQSMPLEAHYFHVSHAISLSETGEVSKVPDTPANKRLWNALEDLDFDRFINDHQLETYIDRINSLLKEHN